MGKQIVDRSRVTSLEAGHPFGLPFFERAMPLARVTSFYPCAWKFNRIPVSSNRSICQPSFVMNNKKRVEGEFAANAEYAQVE